MNFTAFSPRLLRCRRSGVCDLDIECAKTPASSVTREREGESSLSSLSRSLSLRLLRSWRSGVVTLTLSANSGVDARRRAWPVNLMVKAPFPPLPVLFLHGCCVLGARVYVTLTLSGNGGVDARCRAWPVNLMVKAFPVLFLHGCCVVGARGNVTLLGGTWPWPWVRTAASTPQKTIKANGGVDARRRDTWTWWWKLSYFLPTFTVTITGPFTTAAAFSAFGGTWPWSWVRTAASTP